MKKSNIYYILDDGVLTLELTNNQSYESVLDILCKMIRLHLKEEGLTKDEEEKKIQNENLRESV